MWGHTQTPGELLVCTLFGVQKLEYIGDLKKIALIMTWKVASDTPTSPTVLRRLVWAAP